MATQIFFRSETSDWTTGNNDTGLAGAAPNEWRPRALALTRGSGLTTATRAGVLGPTSGIEMAVNDGANNKWYVWYSPPIDADITISGSVTWNLWSSVNSMSTNAAINGRLEVVDGATGTITLIDQTARSTELTTSQAAENFAETPGAGIACKRGDRFRVRVFADDGGGTMAAIGVVSFGFSGGSAAADGDSYFTLTENVTFASEPAGTTVYLTDTASSIATASVDRQAWTSRGAGVQTDVRTHSGSFAAPLQFQDTGGGTVVDWWTNGLPAMTLGGAVRCNVRGSTTTAPAAAMRAEIAIANSDGSSPVVWGAGTNGTEIATSESASSFLVSGDDTSVSANQVLRIRLYIDEPGPLPGSIAHTLYYAGTSGGASGDTYFTFTQDLTAAAATYLPPGRQRRMQILAN